MKKDKKMRSEDIQGLLLFRKRGYVKTNKKHYSRKEKYKKSLDI